MSNLVTEVPEVFPPVAIPLPTEEPRHAMIAALKVYLATLSFRRPGPVGQVFQVKPRDILEEWPDPEHQLNFPSIAVLPGIGEDDYLAFTPIVVDETYNVYSYGTALVQDAEYVETLQVSWSADKGRARAIAGCAARSRGRRLRPAIFETIRCVLPSRGGLIDGGTARSVRRLHVRPRESVSAGSPAEGS